MKSSRQRFFFFIHRRSELIFFHVYTGERRKFRGWAWGSGQCLRSRLPETTIEEEATTTRIVKGITESRASLSTVKNMN